MGLKIEEARVIVCCPGRNFVTLKIITNEGIYGLGDATLNGRELSVVSYLEDHVIPCLLEEILIKSKTFGSFFIGERIGAGARLRCRQ